MKFNSSSSVASVVYELKRIEDGRSEQRSWINSLANGDPPYSTQEAIDNNIDTNVNFLQAPSMLHMARGTVNNALLKPGNVFRVSVDSGPLYRRGEIGTTITSKINKYIKRSKAYVENIRAKGAQAILHGVGPTNWENATTWCPSPIAIGDLLIPSKTFTSLENLEFFAIRRQYNITKLYNMTHGKNVDKGWNMKVVNQLLDKMKEDNYAPIVSTFSQNAEQVVEDWKADLGYFDSEQTPSVIVYDFYHRNEESDKPSWHRKMLLDADTPVEMGTDFLYDPKREFAIDLDRILHILFADGANVAPFRYHSVRGLGWMIYAVCHLQNRLMCKFNDANFEQLMWYFYVSSPDDRERLNKVDLHHLGAIPEGLKFLTAGDRYKPDANFVNMGLSLNNQLMADASSQFREGIDNGTSKEMTAQEVIARMNSANAIVGSMLSNTYLQQSFEHREIARRFCIKDSKDPDAKKFQEECKKEGVPAEMLDVERWNIEPERVMGSGNKTLEIAQAKEMLSIRGLLDPEPQRKVLHDFILAVTDDPAKAKEYAPLTEKIASDAVHDAQLTAGALMAGLPVKIKTGVNHIEVIEALLTSLGIVLDRIAKTGNKTDEKELFGLQNIVGHIAQHLQILAQDQSQKERVKKYGDALGKFSNLIKALAQRLQQEQQANQPQMSPEDQVALQAEVAKNKLREVGSMQKMKQKQQSFAASEVRKQQQHEADLLRQAQDAAVTAQATDIKTAADVRAKALSVDNSSQT